MSDQPRGEMIEIKGQPATYYGTADPQRDTGKITGRDDPPTHGGKR